MSTPAQTPITDSSRQLLRHALATLAYRGGKAVRGVTDEFPGFHASETTRTPVQILAHMGDLMEWALSMAKGKQVWRDSVQLPWAAETQRFFASLQAFDSYLASDSPLNTPAEKLFQGPVADALTHVGQLMMLRRIAGAPPRGENYFVADIVTGRVGSEQSAPIREFE
jgi:hypothetical protein